MDIASHYSMLLDFLKSDTFFSLVRVTLIVVIGVPLTFFISRIIGNFSLRYGSEHLRIIVTRAALYITLAFLGVSVLHELGFQITALLGAAGIAGAALAFASQTSVSHVISGVFLLTERSFSIGDIIEINGIMGTVVSIDLLSVKLKTFDQRMVRVPNETLIKQELQNISYFPHRRLNFVLNLAHTENVRNAIEIIKDTIGKNEFSDKTMAPLVYLKEHTETTIHIFVGSYARQKNYFPMLKSLTIEIKEAFDAQGIKVPYKHIKIISETNQPM